MIDFTIPGKIFNFIEIMGYWKLTKEKNISEYPMLLSIPNCQHTPIYFGAINRVYRNDSETFVVSFIIA